MFRTIGDVVRSAAAVTGVPARMIMQYDREPQSIRARRAVIWIARRDMRKTLGEIAYAMDRDHTTIMHNLRLVRDDDDWSAFCAPIRAHLREPTWRDRVAADIAARGAIYTAEASNGQTV